MNDSLSFLEVATIVASLFGCVYAGLAAASLPRQIWRGPIAAFGCGIIALGVAGMTDTFFQGLEANVGGSRATRNLVFDELIQNGWRPGFISTMGLIAFVAMVWTSSSGDDEKAANHSSPLAVFMVLGAAASLIGMAAYIIGFFTAADPTHPTSVMVFTNIAAKVTIGICLIGGLWTALQASNWSSDQTS